MNYRIVIPVSASSFNSNHQTWEAKLLFRSRALRKETFTQN